MNPDRDHIASLLDLLSTRELAIIFARYGLDGQQPKTLATIGHEHGLTRSRIHQIQAKALFKLRRALSKT